MQTFRKVLPRVHLGDISQGTHTFSNVFGSSWSRAFLPRRPPREPQHPTGQVSAQRHRDFNGLGARTRIDRTQQIPSRPIWEGFQHGHRSAKSTGRWRGTTGPSIRAFTACNPTAGRAACATGKLPRAYPTRPSRRQKHNWHNRPIGCPPPSTWGRSWSGRSDRPSPAPPVRYPISFPGGHLRARFLLHLFPPFGPFGASFSNRLFFSSAAIHQSLSPAGLRGPLSLIAFFLIHHVWSPA